MLQKNNIFPFTPEKIQGHIPVTYFPVNMRIKNNKNGVKIRKILISINYKLQV